MQRIADTRNIVTNANIDQYKWLHQQRQMPVMHCYSAWKVTAGLAESNKQLAAGFITGRKTVSGLWMSLNFVDLV